MACVAALGRSGLCGSPADDRAHRCCGWLPSPDLLHAQPRHSRHCAATLPPYRPTPTTCCRAVKSPNILLTATGTAKLADCGFSKIKHDGFLSTVSLVGTCECWSACQLTAVCQTSWLRFDGGYLPAGLPAS